MSKLTIYLGEVARHVRATLVWLVTRDWFWMAVSLVVELPLLIGSSVLCFHEVRMLWEMMDQGDVVTWLSRIAIVLALADIITHLFHRVKQTVLAVLRLWKRVTPPSRPKGC